MHARVPATVLQAACKGFVCMAAAHALKMAKGAPAGTLAEQLYK